MTTLHDLLLQAGVTSAAGRLAQPRPVPYRNATAPRPLPRTMRPADVRANDPQLAQSERDIAMRELQRGDTLGRFADMGAAQSAPDPIHTPLQSNVIAGSRMVLPGAYDAGNAAGRIARGEDAWGDLALNTGMAALPFLGVRGMRGEPAPAPMREPLPPQAWNAFGDLPPAEAPRPNAPPLQASGTGDARPVIRDFRTTEPQASPDANAARAVQASDGNAASGGGALEGEVMPHPIAPRAPGRALPTEFRREPAQSNDPLAAGYGFDGPRNTRFRLSVDPGPTGAEVTLEAFDPQGRTIYDMPNHFSPAEAMEIYRNAEGALRSDMSMYQRDAYMISGMDDRLSTLHEAMLRRAERRGELPSGFELRTNVPGLGGSFLNRPGSPAIEAQTRMGEALGRLDAATLEHRSVRSLQSPNANAPPPPDRTPKSLPRRKPPNGGFFMPRGNP